ncbi:induced myeloid leukemia cell differentiation protein Mcl-1-like [Clarias gariepinus]|uniref:induced myeloid leukemia cell differentiation protein Mcl-1-like n=1 Tax=Clarias gariepinus TaxID=13013 RepID=UPI00234DBE4F|nr:induced myeloid leukemia cell differentiation protein Mcl-1-like [Clarias gariepinus]
MSLSMMKRTAPLSLLCCGAENGGVSGVAPPMETFSQREEELDGYTEEPEAWPVKAGLGDTESRLQPEAGGEELERETRELLRQLYRAHTGLGPSPRQGRAHPALPSLQRVLRDLLSKHRIAYSGMVQRLFDQAQGLDSVQPVLRGVFSDGVMSWGRIASVLALGAVVCERLTQECVKDRAEDIVDIVASQISSYLSTELQHWFINNKGWDGFVEFFRVEDPESTVRNALMAVAGLGIGACLFTLMR